FDFKNNIWTIPKERMKSMREHQVPLSREALTLLKHLPQTNSSYLFTKFNKNKPINNRAMLIKCNQLDGAKYLKDKIGWRDQQANKITVHGFRSTFRDWAAEQTHFENIVVEKALAHTI